MANIRSINANTQKEVIELRRLRIIYKKGNEKAKALVEEAERLYRGDDLAGFLKVTWSLRNHLEKIGLYSASEIAEAIHQKYCPNRVNVGTLLL